MIQGTMIGSGECSSSKQGMQHAVMLLALLVVVIVAYGQSLFFGFVWDDYGLIIQNDYIKDMSGWSQLFVRNFWQIVENVEDQARSFYRPVITLSYALEYALWGTWAAGYHAVNVVAHGVCAWLVYALVAMLFGSRWRALMVAMLFAVFPVHVENVYWISGRTDVFCTVFYLISFISYLRWSSARAWAGLWFAGLTLGYCLSLLCKEMALSLPCVVLTYRMVCQRETFSRERFRPAFLFLVLITTGYLFIRYYSLGRLASQPIFGSEWERLISVPMVFCHYLALLTGFAEVDPHHSIELLTTVQSVRFAGCMAGCLAYLMLLIHLLRLRLRKAVFFGLWIPLTLVPVMRLGAFGDVLSADRFLYLPSVGYACLLMLAGVFACYRVLPVLFKRHSRAVVGLVVTFYVVIQILLVNLYGTVWKSDLTLFARAVRTSPDSAYIYNNYGSALAKNGMHNDAVKAYVTALALVPEYGSVYTKMGFSLKQLGRYEEAIECFLRARALDSHSVMLYNNMGFCFRHLNYLDSAMQCYRLSVLYYPNEAAYNNLGECFMALGEYGRAENVLALALAVDSSVQANNNKGLCRLHFGDPKGARTCFKTALQASGRITSGEEAVVRANLARAFVAMGESEMAEREALAVAHMFERGVSNRLDDQTDQFVRLLSTDLQKGSEGRRP